MMGAGTRMAATSEQATQRMTGRKWIVVALLIVSVVINYIDRSNLSLAVPSMQKQFALSAIQVGALLSAFYWTYALLQLFGFVGWITDRFPVGWVMVGGYLLWTGSTALTGLATGFMALYATRLLLGVGESVAYPCYSRVFADMPEASRGRANALIDAGTKIGPSIGLFLGGLILERYHWPVLFIALGAGGLLWLVPWIGLMPKVPHQRELSQSAARLSIARLLTKRSAWGSFIGHFCGNYFYYFLMGWLPYYLVGEQKMSVGAAGKLTSAIFFLTATATIMTGWLTDRAIARGATVTRVRKRTAVWGLTIGSGLMWLGLVDKNLKLSIAVIAVTCTAYGVYSANHWAMTQTLAGPRIAGRWSSVQNGVANLSGVASTWIAGLILEVRGSSRMAFAITGGVALCGALAWGLLVDKVEEVQWDIEEV
jgi:MFS transporter, ACS family, D-galactonate transporter